MTPRSFLGGNQWVEFSRLFVLDGFQPERYSPLAQQRYSLKYRYIVQSYRGRTQSLVAKKKDISENRASRNFDLMITMTFEHSSSSLGRQCQMVSAENNTSGPVPQCSMMFDRNRSSLGLHGNDVCSHQFRPRSSSNDFCS
ncbi:hypothetical protein Tco_0205252 [Tanacetum coccineum]